MIRERLPHHHRIHRCRSPRRNRRRQGRRLSPVLERRVFPVRCKCTTPELQQAQLFTCQWRRSRITPCHLRPLRRRQCPTPVRDFKSRPHTIRERPTLARFGLRRTGEAHSGPRNRSGLQPRPSTQRPPARCLEEILPDRTRLHPRRLIRSTRTPLRRGRLLSSTGASRLRSTLGNRLLILIPAIGRLNLPSLALRHHRHMLPRLCLPT